MTYFNVLTLKITSNWMSAYFLSVPWLWGACFPIRPLHKLPPPPLPWTLLRTCRRAGRWAEGWAALWSTACTGIPLNGCPAWTHPCSGLGSAPSQIHAWKGETHLVNYAAACPPRWKINNLWSHRTILFVSFYNYLRVILKITKYSQLGYSFIFYIAKFEKSL